MRLYGPCHSSGSFWISTENNAALFDIRAGNVDLDGCYICCVEFFCQQSVIFHAAAGNIDDDVHIVLTNPWQRFFEEHREYAYTPEQLTGYLKAAGFTHIGIFGDRRLEAPREGEQRIYFKARKGKRK